MYDETLDHISQQHPEIKVYFPSMQAAILQAVENPTHVEQSYENSYVYVSSDTKNSAGQPLRVPVKASLPNVQNPKSGRVRTAYFAENKQKAVILWKRI